MSEDNGTRTDELAQRLRDMGLSGVQSASLIVEGQSPAPDPGSAQCAAERRERPGELDASQPFGHLEEAMQQLRLADRWYTEHELITIEELKLLFDAGLSPAQAIDYLGVKKFGYTQTEWAEIRNRERQSIHSTTTEAKEILGDD